MLRTVLSLHRTPLPPRVARELGISRPIINLSRAPLSKSIVIENPITLRELEAVLGTARGAVKKDILGVAVVIVIVIIIVIMIWSVSP